MIWPMRVSFFFSDSIMWYLASLSPSVSAMRRASSMSPFDSALR